MQNTILLISLAGMIVIALFFIAAIRASGKSAKSPSGTESLRKNLILGLLGAGLIITVMSLWAWPHDVSAGKQAITVNVTGAQWSWEIDRQELPAGVPVIFNVHSKDVNHGMGVIDENGRLLVQTQSMPGYVNQVRYVFDHPGKYKVICLEYCGVAHHDMTDEITVIDKKG